MKKILLLIILARAICVAAQSNSDGYDLRARYNDSLLIYTTFQSEVTALHEASDMETWIKHQSHDADITGTAFRRLRVYNKKDYPFTDEFTREAFGEAHLYPMPTSKFLAREYTVTEHQTHFITASDGKTKTPYFLRFTFTEGKLVHTEKINPVDGSSLGKPADVAMDVPRK